MNTRILVVDDEESVRSALAKVLRAEGHDVILAENSRVAIEKSVHEQIDLALLDLGLPEEDGWTVLKWLQIFYPLVPVIVITGRWKQAEAAKIAGANMLMEKPLDVPVLLRSIRLLLEEPVEARARHVFDRKPDFRSIGCDSHQFRASLESRFSAPFNQPDPKHN